jgi:hypothetical protein
MLNLSPLRWAFGDAYHGKQPAGNSRSGITDIREREARKRQLAVPDVRKYGPTYPPEPSPLRWAFFRPEKSFCYDSSDSTYDSRYRW